MQEKHKGLVFHLSLLLSRISQVDCIVKTDMQTDAHKSISPSIPLIRICSYPVLFLSNKEGACARM